MSHIGPPFNYHPYAHIYKKLVETGINFVCLLMKEDQLLQRFTDLQRPSDSYQTLFGHINMEADFIIS